MLMFKRTVLIFIFYSHLSYLPPQMAADRETGSSGGAGADGEKKEEKS